MANDFKSIEKAFNKMEKDKKKRDKEDRKRRNRDVWTVLAILASVMLLALAIAWLKSGEAVVKEFVGDDPEKAKEIFETTRNVLFGAGFLSIIAVIIYIVKRIKYKKSPESKEAFIDYDRLDAARARVEKARMEQSKQQGEMNVYNAYETYSDDASKNRKPEGMSEAEYRKKRQEEYEKYMSMDFADEDMHRRNYGTSENDLHTEDMSFYEKVKELFSEHKIAVSIGISVVVMTVIVIVCMLMI